MAGISSFSAAVNGLPQFCDSSRANSAPRLRCDRRASAAARRDPSAPWRPSREMPSRPPSRRLRSAPREASATCAMTLPVAGSSTSCSSPLPLTSLPLMSSFVFIVGPREVVSEQDRDAASRRSRSTATTLVIGRSRGRNSSLKNQIGSVRSLPAVNMRDDDFVERQREREHAAGEERGGDLRQHHVAGRSASRRRRGPSTLRSSSCGRRRRRATTLL